MFCTSLNLLTCQPQLPISMKLMAPLILLLLCIDITCRRVIGPASTIALYFVSLAFSVTDNHYRRSLWLHIKLIEMFFYIAMTNTLTLILTKCSSLSLFRWPVNLSPTVFELVISRCLGIFRWVGLV